MSEVANSQAAAGIMDVARDRENVAVGDELVRHKLSSRVMHWTVALTFMVTLLTGMPIWSPVFGWMAYLFGGLTVCRWLHAWSGVAFSISMVVMLAQWAREMMFTATDRKFNIREYLRFSEEGDQEVGKYNAGQKFFFWAALATALLLLLTGVPLWWPINFSWRLRQVCILLHDVGFIGFFCAIVGHVYLGTAAEPGTFRSMTRGTVTRAWARLHHPRWFRDVTGDRR